MSFRPEGWQNPFPIESENNPDSAYAIGRRSYESGADAMLKAINECLLPYGIHLGVVRDLIEEESKDVRKV